MRDVVLYQLLSLDGVAEEPRLFGADDLRRLELVDVERTPVGHVLLGYRVAATG